MMFDVPAVTRLTGLRRAAVVAAGSMVALSAVLAFSLSAFAQGPPIDGTTDPTDPRCTGTSGNTENVFFLNMPTPAAGDPAPGQTIASWFADETGLNQGSADPSSQFYLFFHLTGPGVDEKLTADMTSEFFDQSKLFHGKYHECKKQVNIKTQIPATVNGGAYPPGDYTVSLTAWDNDQRVLGGDLGVATWKFTVAAAQASPSSGVLAASTTGPGLPKTGAAVSTAPDRTIEVAVLFVLASVAAAGVAVARSRRSRERA